MALDFLLDRFDQMPATRALAEQLPAAGGRLPIAGLPGSSPAVLVAALARRMPQRVFVVLAPTASDAERWVADAGVLAGDAVALYPQREGLGAEEPHVEIAGERVETIEALLRGAIRVLVTPARATAELTGVPATLESTRLVLAAGRGKGEGGSLTLTAVVQQLESMGFARVPTVTEVGQFSVRGAIIDVYGFGMAAPARIEWWGDEIISVRTFDLDSQRSGDAVERVTVLPVRTERSAPHGDGGPPMATRRSSLLDLLPSDALLVI